MSDWRDCIVTFIDMIGVSYLLQKQSSEAVSLVRRMHRVIQNASQALEHHEEICFWNDSILAVGFVDETSESYERIMREVRYLKTIVDAIKPSYAICVKGKSFPPPPNELNSLPSGVNPRMIYLQASSLAFANCFTIEKELKKHRKSWYIDVRIIRQVSSRKPDLSKRVTLFPQSTKRSIHMFKDDYTKPK